MLASLSVWPHHCRPKDSEETYGLLNSAGYPPVNSVSRKHCFSVKKFQKLPNCSHELRTAHWLDANAPLCTAGADVSSRLPELATASMYWPLMTPSCLAKTKPSIRGAAGTDGSCVNPPWTHQSFQSLLNPFICHSFHKTKLKFQK